MIPMQLYDKGKKNASIPFKGKREITSAGVCSKFANILPVQKASEWH